MFDTTKLNRFIEAQNTSGFAGYKQAVEELKRGKKLSHWIWYVFPQLRSISQNSPDEKKYGIENIEEAKAYLNNPTLRERLDEVCDILLGYNGKTAVSIFGVADSSRVRSSMTLFYLASKNELYKQVLDKYFYGRPCQNTLFALNMKMPDTVSISNSSYSGSKQSEDKTESHTKHIAKPRHFTIKDQQQPLKKNKIKKIAILIAGFIGIIGLCGGIGYEIYALLRDMEDNPAIAETTLKDSTIIDLHVNVAVLTADQDTITFKDKDRYSLSLLASLGNSSVQLDSLTNAFLFAYNNDNSWEEIKIEAKIDTCPIGGKTYSLSNYETKEGVYDETFNLDVCKADLCIYQELTWYESAKKKVASAKYTTYTKRIKNVQNKAFAELLTKKLTSIGQAQEVKPEPQEVNPKSNGNSVLSPDIRHYIRMAVPVPMSRCEKLEQNERKIIQSYNREIIRSKEWRNRMDNHNIERLLRKCSTFRELEKVIREIRLTQDEDLCY